MRKKLFDYEKIPNVIEGLPVVQDIEKAIDCLVNQKIPIARFEFGNSMMPILSSGQFCKISPVDHHTEINVGDALFCDVNGYVGTHMVLLKSQIDPDNTWYMIGMTDMQPIGWTKTVYGVANAINYAVATYPKTIAAVSSGRFFG